LIEELGFLFYVECWELEGKIGRKVKWGEGEELVFWSWERCGGFER